MSVVAGVDIGNATTEVVVLDGGRLLGADRLPTRGRKGSADSLRGAAALVRRIERRLGTTVGEARIAPLRAVGTATLTIPAAVPDTGRLRMLATGVATPGGAGTCVGAPLWLDGERLEGEGLGGPAGPRGGRAHVAPPGSRWCPPASATRPRRGSSASSTRLVSPSGRSSPEVTRPCSSPTASASRSPSSTRLTWPRRPPAPCWPWRCAAPASR